MNPAPLDVAEVKAALRGVLDGGTPEAEIIRRLDTTEAEIGAVLSGRVEPSPALATRLRHVVMFEGLPPLAKPEPAPVAAPKPEPVRLIADRGQLERFHKLLFKHADPSAYVSLRAFPHGDNRPPFEILPVRADGAVVDRAVELAQRCADAAERIVFCPPVCTFASPDNAKGANVAQGLSLGVEIDADPAMARERMEKLLGPATIVVESGGLWTHPETGEAQPKLHLHWRLARPTRDAAEHAKLKEARRLATKVAGGDPSNSPLVHPIRWPGTWHRKGEPRLCRIVAEDPDAELDLAAAHAALANAAGETATAQPDGAASGYGMLRPRALPTSLVERMARKPEPDEDRSTTAFGVFRSLQELGYSMQDAAATVEAYPEGVGERYAGARDRLIADLERAYGKPFKAPVLDPREPLRSAQMFLVQHYATLSGRRTLHFHNGQFYRWGGTCYSPAEAQALKAEVYAFLDRAERRTKATGSAEAKVAPFRPTQATVNEVLEALKAVAHLPDTLSSPVWLDLRHSPSAADVVPCANGLLHLPALELLPHTPALFNVNALDFGYAPDALAPIEWTRFLAELWPDDPGAIDTLQEVFGYFLATDTRQQKIVMLVGPKRSGKGTIGRVLTRMLGQANVVSPTLASLGQNFGLAALIGKPLAIVADARLSGRTDQSVLAERLLSVSGEDGITVDRKYLPVWTGRLPTRFLILTNELPKLMDASGALASRFIVLMLSNSFFGREDPGLTERLCRELPGILNWAIEGWQRLNARGYFKQPESSLRAAAELEALGSPIKAFIEDRCRIGPRYSVTCDALFAEWGMWCRANADRRPGDMRSFGRLLAAAHPEIKRKQKRISGKKEWCYFGVALSPTASPSVTNAAALFGDTESRGNAGV